MNRREAAHRARARVAATSHRSSRRSFAFVVKSTRSSTLFAREHFLRDIKSIIKDKDAGSDFYSHRSSRRANGELVLGVVLPRTRDSTGVRFEFERLILCDEHSALHRNGRSRDDFVLSLVIFLDARVDALTRRLTLTR